MSPAPTVDHRGIDVPSLFYGGKKCVFILSLNLKLLLYFKCPLIAFWGWGGRRAEPRPLAAAHGDGRPAHGPFRFSTCAGTRVVPESPVLLAVSRTRILE